MRLYQKRLGVKGIYDRYRYFDERKAAPDTWTRLLVARKAGEYVVPIRAAKSAPR